MFKKLGALCIGVWLMLCMSGVLAAAETTVPSTSVTTAVTDTAYPLLSEETTVADATASFSYTVDGALTVTSTTAGATVAIDLSQEFHLETMRYLQLSLESTVPFNLALKLSGKDYDIYPQTTGPSWYEAFQAEAPKADSGVAAGRYTMALDVLHYAEYNGLALQESGMATVKRVYLTLYAPGKVTVSHLKLGAKADFITADGKSGTAATTLAPIITHDDTTNLPTKYAYYDGGDIAALDDTVRQDEESPLSVVMLIAVGVLLIAAMVLLTILNKRREKISLEEPQDEDERENEDEA